MKNVAFFTFKGILNGLILLLGIPAMAQTAGEQSFSLKEAQEFALQHSYAMRNASIDLDLAKKKIWETTAIGLPQVNASIEYSNMLEIPTTLLPDFITPSIVAVNENLFGLSPTQPLPETQFFPAQFGTKHNMNIGGTVSQLVFSGEYIVGLQASRTYYDVAKKSQEKSAVDTRELVTQSYYQVLVTREAARITRNQLSTLEKLVYEAKEAEKNGLIEDITLKQMEINLDQLRNGVNSVERGVEVTERLLKFQMGLDVNAPLNLEDSLGSFMPQLNRELIPNGNFSPVNHIDYKLFETQEKLQYLGLRREQSTYLPTLAAFYTYQKNAMRSEFDIFEGGKDWYPTSIVGLNLSIPIFSSGMRYFKVQQAKLNLLKMRTTKEQIGQGLILAAETARLTYNNAVETYLTDSRNKELSSSIYEKSLKKFREGLITSTELTTIQNQYLSSLNSYYGSVYKLLEAKIKYDKATNNF